MSPRQLFFSALFGQMHASLLDIKAKTFDLAENHLLRIRTLLEMDGAVEIFVGS
jgi:hypothetical protein